VEDTVTCVTVGVVPPPPPPPPLPPPQPRVKLNTHIKASPSAARYRFRPGTNSNKIAARPVPPLSVHHPPLRLGAVGKMAARKFCVSGKFMAVVVEDGAATLTVSVPVPFPLLGTVTFRAPQVTPGKAVPHVIATLPVNPPVGVSVIVDVPLPPAVTVAAVPAKLKLPVPVDCVTVSATFPVPDELEVV